MIYQPVSASETKTFTLALGQMRVAGGEVTENLARALATIEAAKKEGAALVVLPEVLDCGWCDQSGREEAGEIPGGPSFATLARAATKHSLHVCAGLTEREGDLIYNAAVLLAPDGRLLLKHRKVNELDFAKRVYTTGTTAEAVCHTTLGRIGLMICADGFIAGETISRSLAAQGARLIVSPCAWAVPPHHDQEREPYGALWRDVYGRVAKESGIWIAGASNVGTIRHGPWAGRHCIGCSMLVGPDGDVHAQGSYGPDAEEIIHAPIRL